jgi:hypothetical protein
MTQQANVQRSTSSGGQIVTVFSAKGRGWKDNRARPTCAVTLATEEHAASASSISTLLSVMSP